MTTQPRVGLRSLLLISTVLALWVPAALAHDDDQNGVRPGECMKEVGESSKKECSVDEDCNQNKKCCPTGRGGTVCRQPAVNCRQLECRTCHTDFKTGLPTCAVNGNWGAWGEYTSCSLTCGGGLRERTRSCDSPAPAYGGENCQGELAETEWCNSDTCPINGNWGAWGEYTSCSVTCGQGLQERTRACDSPAPAYGGDGCQGEDAETDCCSSDPCPVNGNWGEWEEYSCCSVTCGVGSMERTRVCDSPAPASGGDTCEGEDTEVELCNSGPCSL